MNEQQVTTGKALFLKDKAKTMDELADWFGITKMTLYKRFREEDWTKGDTALINIKYEEITSNNRIKLNAELPNPNGQLQETLYELITRKEISRESMMKIGVRNLTARISDLRIKFGNSFIKNNEYITINKFGRTIDYVNYEIVDREKAIENYLILINGN